METSLLSILALGLFLGFRHSLDPDHLVAVSTIATRTKSSVKAGMTGVFWGLGHSVTIFLVGIIVLIIDAPMPQKLDSFFEFLVGLLLVYLGVKTIRVAMTMKEQFLEQSSVKKYHAHSFLVGIVHGLAGSAGLLLLIINQVNDMVTGILFLLLFGAGSIFGMFFSAMLFSIPIRMARTEKIQKGIFYSVRLISTGFGIVIFLG